MQRSSWWLTSIFHTVYHSLSSGKLHDCHHHLPVMTAKTASSQLLAHASDLLPATCCTYKSCVSKLKPPLTFPRACSSLYFWFQQMTLCPSRHPNHHIRHSSVFFISSQLLHSLVTKSVLCPHFSILSPLVLPHKISHWTTYKQSLWSFHATLHSVFSLRRAISSAKSDWPWFKGHQWTWYSDRVPQPADLQGLLICHTLGLLTTSLINYWRTILNSI